MPVRNVKTRGKPKRRTVLPTKKQAMSYRHRTLLQTPICPEGQRLINGKCSSANGVNFSGHTYDTLSPMKQSDVGKRKSDDLTTITINVPEGKTLNLNDINVRAQSMSPSWLKFQNVNTNTLSLIYEFLNNQTIPTQTLNILSDKMNKVKVSNELNGKKILNSMLNDVPNAWISFITDLDDEGENQLMGSFAFWMIFTVLVMICLWGYADMH